jgi:hypothetical protein
MDTFEGEAPTLQVEQTVAVLTASPSAPTSSSPRRPAKTSPLPESVQGSLALGVDSSSISSGWFESYSRLGFAWSKSPDSSAATGERTSASRSTRWQTQGISWNGGYWMRGGSEYPNGAEGCSLSDILEDRPPDRFSLSPKAAKGILRRAERRGRMLPMRLEAALVALATQTATTTSPRSDER